MKKIKIYTDGASRGNPGNASIGILITDEDGNELKTFGKYIGKATNNTAEYTALIESVKLLKDSEFEFDGVDFFSDSELMVKQLNGDYKIKHQDMIALAIEFHKSIRSLNKPFTITHIARSQNAVTDKLANKALDQYLFEQQLK